VLVGGEVPLTLARDGVLPAWFGKTSRAGTPVRAQVVAGVVATILILSNYSKSMSGLFAFSALVTTVSSLFVYAAVAAAGLALVANKRIRSAILPFVAVPGLLFSLWAFWGAGLEPSLWGIGLLATGIPIYFLTRRGGRSSPESEAPAAAPVG
jgi:APA family basic amino acid/polyamine antiporter